MIRVLSIVLVSVVLGACMVSQLSEFKKLEQANDEAAIESKPLSAGCFVAQPSAECAQAAEIQGRACLTLARQESAPDAACPPATATAQRRLQCAAKDFEIAKHDAGISAADLADDTENRARALYCGATLEARTTGLVDARQALADLDTLPPSPGRDELAADTLVYVAQTESLDAAERCRAAQQAASRTARGLSENPTSKQQNGLKAAHRDAASAAAAIGDCRFD